MLAGATIVFSSTSFIAGTAYYSRDAVIFTTGRFIGVYVVSLLILLAVIIRNLISVIHSRSKSMANAAAKTEGEQAKFVLLGIVATTVLGLASNIVIPLIGTNWNSTRYGPFLTVVFVATLSYSIVRHKLFDIRGYVLRALVYALTLSVISVIYIAPAIYLLAIVIMGYTFTPLRFTAGVIFATFAALYFENIRTWFDNITSRIFFRDTYDSALFLKNLNRQLVSTIELDTMLRGSSQLIAETIKADFCVVALHETSAVGQRFIGTINRRMPTSSMQTLSMLTEDVPGTVIVTDFIEDERKLKMLLQKSNVASLIKLSHTASSQNKSLGFVMLGYKKSGNPYTSKDTQALEAIADVLTIAIQNALRFEEIQNFNITLQQQVADATRQLRRTNAKLVALDETKDDFISMASHQLRTPLTAVKGYVSMVLEGDAGKVTPMQRRMLNQAFMSSQRMVYLIADLLNVSRLKTGKFEIERTPVNLAQMISEEIGQLQEEAASHSIKLAYDKPNDFPTLMLDETKTRQVVMNFIDNALHYTPSNGHIEVQLHDSPHSVELKVVDDGIGVPKTEQHHLFTKFYRAVNAQRQRPDGTGLGLFMAKKVIVAQGGAVIFSSREGKGSTFGFTMPKSKVVVK